MPYRKSLAPGILAALLGLTPVAIQAVPISTPGSDPSTSAERTRLQAKIDEAVDALDRNDLASAERAFGEAARIDPKSATPYLGLAEVAGRRNQLPDVESWLKKAMAADPRSVVAIVTWGRYQFKRGRFSDAEASYKKAIELDPKSVDAHVQLGENYFLGLKKPKAAEDAYRAAIKLDGSSVPAHMGLAAALTAQRQFDAAAAQFEEAAKLVPHDPKPVHLLSRLYASEGKIDQALATLARSIKIAPDYLPAYVERGDLYLAKNEVDKAIAEYRAGTKAAPKAAIAYFKLGTLYQAQRKWSDAERAYLSAVKDDPRMYGAYNNLAWMAATRKERLNDALAWINQAIQIAPRAMTLYGTLGWVHRARGELDLAAKAIEKAVAGLPTHASFQYHLGIVYSEQGKTNEAIAAFRKALELDKDFRDAADARKQLEKLGAK